MLRRIKPNWRTQWIKPLIPSIAFRLMLTLPKVRVSCLLVWRTWTAWVHLLSWFKILMIRAIQMASLMKSRTTSSTWWQASRLQCPGGSRTRQTWSSIQIRIALTLLNRLIKHSTLRIKTTSSAFKLINRRVGLTFQVVRLNSPSSFYSSKLTCWIKKTMPMYYSLFKVSQHKRSHITVRSETLMYFSIWC